MRKFNLLPYSEIHKGSKIAIYGAGVVGLDYVKQASTTHYCSVVFVADKNYANITDYKSFGVDILSPLVFVERCDFDCVLIATIYDDYRSQMLDYLYSVGVPKSKIITQSFSVPIGKESTYSQHGEDMIIVNAFKHIGFFKDDNLPSYIDVGAHHPFNYSNTALLYQLGCRGINIEANPVLFKEFEKMRPEDLNLCVGIGSSKGEFPFYVSDVSLLGSFKKENLEFNELLNEKDTGVKTEYKLNDVINLPVETLTFVVEQYCNNKWPNFMSIDIEGLEYESLKICDFSNGPEIIVVEVNFDGDLFIEMFKEKGYFPYLWFRNNIIFIKNECKPFVHEHEKR